MTTAATIRAAKQLARLLAEARRACAGAPAPAPAPQPALAGNRLDQIIHYYRAGLDGRSIAARLGVSVHTVNTTILRARRNGAWPADLKRGRGRRGRCEL